MQSPNEPLTQNSNLENIIQNNLKKSVVASNIES
jgi:hypothetical protein